MTDLLEAPSIRPLVLVVEDVPEHLDTRLSLFATFDCLAIGARSRKDAIHELENAPLPDLVVTDIHMPERPRDHSDMSGVDLARYVRAKYNHLPIVGYSAYFEDSEIDSSASSLFEVVFPKRGNSPVRLQRQVQTCVELAVSSREHRIAQFLDQLDDLKRRYESSQSVVEVRRRLTLDRQAEDFGSRVEGQLGEAGYRLRVVAGAPFISDEPVVVWVNSDKTGFYAEIYGRPEVYAHGSSESDALNSLAELTRLLDGPAR